MSVNIDVRQYLVYSLGMIANPQFLEPLPLLDELEACCPRLLTAPIADEEAELAARIFRALADPGRVRLLSIIASAGENGACVCELVPSLDLSQPTVSHHLKVLHEAGLISRERKRSWVYYRLRKDSVSVVTRALKV
jgi:ArsR family transcriptional regulator, arsenate/arsenite/antimonite-responsive transcriptional repressor